MLSHLVLAILADPANLPSISAQRACRVFADYDLSIPRMLNHQLLDQRYAWPPGTCGKLLVSLTRLGVLSPIRAKPSKGEPATSLWMLATGMGWTPKSLA